MIKKCVVCGKEYKCPPTNNVLTCSPECSRKRRSELLKGKEFKAETRQKLSEKAKERGFTDNLKKGTSAAMKSPKMGRFDTNVNAKDWVLISPEGKIYECHSLSNFVRQNPEIFDIDGSEKECNRIINGLKTIKSHTKLGKKGQSYYGWTVDIEKSQK